MALSVKATGSSATDTLSFTCPSGTNLLIVGYTLSRSWNWRRFCTYNGLPMAHTRQYYHSDGDVKLTQIFVMVNPPTGSAHDIEIQPITNSYDGMFAIAIEGADTISPIRSYDENYGESSPSGEISNSISSVAGDLVVDFLAQYRATSPYATGTGQTEIGTPTDCGGASYKDGAASVTMEWDADSTSTNEWVHVLISIKPDTSRVKVLGNPVADIDNNPTSPNSFNHTLEEGNNRMILVGVMRSSTGMGGDGINTPSYGGETMTSMGTGSSYFGSTVQFELFYLLEADLPANGNKTVSYSWAGTMDTAGAICVCLENVLQEVPSDTSEDNATAQDLDEDLTTSVVLEAILSFMAHATDGRITKVNDESTVICGETETQGALHLSAMEKASVGTKNIQWYTSESGEVIYMAQVGIVSSALGGAIAVMLGANF